MVSSAGSVSRVEECGQGAVRAVQGEREPCEHEQEDNRCHDQRSRTLCSPRQSAPSGPETGTSAAWFVLMTTLGSRVHSLALPSLSPGTFLEPKPLKCTHSLSPWPCQSS